MAEINRYDAIIIGSGIGGLTCGNLLAKQGLNTLILEQHSKPGGFATSYKRGGCTFEVLSNIGSLREGDPIEQVLSYIGVTRKMEFIETETWCRIIGPDAGIDWYVDIARFEHGLIEKFPHERKGIHLLIEEMTKIWDETLSSHYNPNHLQMLAYPLTHPRLVRYGGYTVKRFLDKFIGDERLKELLGAESVSLGLNMSRLSALYYICMIMSFHRGGLWFPKGGFQAMSNAFAECFKENGGALRLKTQVKKILIKNGRAVGVELEDGEEIFASHIISNADTKKTFLDLVGPEHLTGRFAKRVRGLEGSSSGFLINLGVSLSMPELMNCSWVSLLPEYGSIDKMFGPGGNKNGGFDQFFSVGSPTIKDPQLAPDGINTITIDYIPAPYAYKNRWLAMSREEYVDIKERAAEELIERAESIIPGLSQNVVVKDICTPRTFERYTSADEGGWFDVALIPKQTLTNRLPIQTPIKGLYLTGAKTMTGPGMGGVIQAGLFTADTILKGSLTGGKCRLKAYPTSGLGEMKDDRQ